MAASIAKDLQCRDGELGMVEATAEVPRTPDDET